MICTAKNELNSKGAASLTEYMTELLNMPVNEEEREQLKATGYVGKSASKGVLLVQSLLEKAIERGDVPAFKEIKVLLDEKNEESNELEEIVLAIKKSLKKEMDKKKQSCKSEKTKGTENKKSEKNTAEGPE